MRFAIKTSPQHTSYADMLSVWQAADDIDVFESGWTFDHFYPIFSDPTGPCLEGWTTLAALAQATTRLRVGVLVTGNPYRHPAVLANMAATLDVISNGRLELGIGAGWLQAEYEQYGIEFEQPAVRLRRLREAGGSNSMPYCSYSACSQPAPMPSSRRPSDRWSIVTSALASTAGWR